MLAEDARMLTESKDKWRHLWILITNNINSRASWGASCAYTSDLPQEIYDKLINEGFVIEKLGFWSKLVWNTGYKISW